MNYFEKKKILGLRKSFEAEDREFAKFVRSLDQFLQTVEGQIIFFSRVPNMTGVLNKSVGRISKKIIKKYQIRL